MSGDFDDEWGEDAFRDPEDDEEETRAIERRNENARLTTEKRDEKVRMGARGISEVPDDEPGDNYLKKLARSHLELSIHTLADVMVNGTKDAARNTAAREMLARGFGSTIKKSEQKVDVKITDQRAAHYAALQELASENPVVDIQDAEFEEIDPRAPKRLERRRDDDED